MPLPSPRPLLTGLVGLMAMFLGSAALAVTTLDCLPPIPPAPVPDAGLRAEYRDEIGQEYSAYFDEAQAYLRCLDRARSAVTEEINRAIADYQTLDSGPGG
jgi:hypothetical protein